MDNVFFSVVIPLYNKEMYVKRSVTSVLNQTYPNFELIVVDDGSIDKSVNEVVTINDSRLKLIKQNNQGVSSARNIGVKYARYEWIAFLDADDEYEINFLLKIKECISEFRNNNISFIGTNYFINDKNHVALSDFNHSILNNYYELFENQRSPNNSSSTVVHKNYFLQIGGFPEDMKHFEDWTTWFKLAYVGKFLYICEPLAIYNNTTGSVSKMIRDNESYYLDAQKFILFLIEIKGQLNSNLKIIQKIDKIIAQFSLNIALSLVGNGSKILSLKLVKYFSFSVVNKEKYKFSLLIYHLLTPLFCKVIFSFIHKFAIHKNILKS